MRIATRPFKEGSHVLPQPWRPKSGVSYDLTGTRLECPGTWAIDLSGVKGTTLVRGTVAGVNTDALTADCKMIGPRFEGPESRWFGGNRREQTGGRNLIEAAEFWKTSIMIAGVAPMLAHCTFKQTPRHAIRFGLLEWDKLDLLGANDALVSFCKFEDCWTEAAENEDYGVVIAMRDWTQNLVFRELSFTRCKAKALYLDDGMSNVVATGLKFTDCDTDLWIGGGRHIRIGAESTGTKYPSRWDNRLSKQKLPGHFDARGHLQDGKIFEVVNRTVKSCPAWLSKIPHYTEDYANRDNWTSSGSLAYRSDGPDIDFWGGPEVARVL